MLMKCFKFKAMPLEFLTGKLEAELAQLAEINLLPLQPR